MAIFGHIENLQCLSLHNFCNKSASNTHRANKLGPQNAFLKSIFLHSVLSNFLLFTLAHSSNKAILDYGAYKILITNVKCTMRTSFLLSFMPLGDQADPTESLIWNIPLKVFLFTGTCTYKWFSTYKCTQLNFTEYFEKHASIYSQEVIWRYLKDIL